MQQADFKLTIHMVCSLDGIIAKNDNSVGWFETNDHYEEGVVPTEEDIAGFLKSIDCYVMGARTYEHALELSKAYGWPYGDIPTIVLSNHELPVDRPNVKLYSGDIGNLVAEELKPNYRNVWLVGGAITAMDFIKHKLAHQLRISIIPIVLGEGKLFFQDINEQPLHLEKVTAYKSGMVELCYEIK